MGGPTNHVLVIVDGSEAAKRAVVEGEAMATEYDALLSVATVVSHGDPAVGCVQCGISVARWNQTLSRRSGSTRHAAHWPRARPRPASSPSRDAEPTGSGRRPGRWGPTSSSCPRTGRSGAASSGRRRVTASVIEVEA